MTFSRRQFLSSCSVFALAGAVGATTPLQAFDRELVISMAREMASRAYQPRETVPQDWQNLTYEQYKSMWFRPDAALWHGTDVPYDVDFFHPGLYFPRPIQINTVQNGVVQNVTFDMSGFDRTDQLPDLTIDETLGYSGFRLRTELTEPGKRNEFCVFQGASYFRAIGFDEIYGLSARGLALKTGDPDGEEFPDFTRFWLETPAPGQRNIVVHALLDSPSVTGAYRFDIIPGPACVMDVEATLFARKDLTHVGLGPLTSMFLFDETNRTRFDDFRPAVHDSDGLMVLNGGGEVLWRPLSNPRRLQVSSFLDKSPRGFGLMQRARRPGDFADLEAHYHRRPSLWVEPRGDWGEGAVTLVEIPADQEIYDNIVAYWRPTERFQKDSRLDLSYRLTWGGQAPIAVDYAHVINTRMGRHLHGGRIATVDFAPHPLLDDGPDGVSIHVSSPHVETSSGVLQRNPETGGLRLAFTFEPGERTLVELRAQLRKEGQMASEVWLYRWTA